MNHPYLAKSNNDDLFFSKWRIDVPCAFAKEDDRGEKENHHNHRQKHHRRKLSGKRLMLTLKRLNMESPAPVRRGLAVHFYMVGQDFRSVETELLSGDSMYGRIKVTPTARLGGEVGIE